MKQFNRDYQFCLLAFKKTTAMIKKSRKSSNVISPNEQRIATKM